MKRIRELKLVAGSGWEWEREAQRGDGMEGRRRKRYLVTCHYNYFAIPPFLNSGRQFNLMGRSERCIHQAVSVAHFNLM